MQSKEREIKQRHRQHLKAIGVLLSIILGGSALSAAPAAAQAATISIPDSVLLAHVNAHLGDHRAPDSEVTMSDALSLRELSAANSWEHDDQNVRNLTGLEHFKNLEELSLYGNSFASISPLASLERLRYLDLRSTTVEDLSPLATLSNLVDLDLSWMRGEPLDISPLAALSGLNTLYMGRASDAEAPAVKSLAPLKKLVNLEELGLAFAGISDISPVSDLHKLRNLNLQDNDIADISALSNLGTLRELNIYGNKISDLTPLRPLTLLQDWNVGRNEIEDLSPLSGLDHIASLHLENNSIVDFSSLGTLRNLTELHIGRQVHMLPETIIETYVSNPVRDYRGKVVPPTSLSAQSTEISTDASKWRYNTRGDHATNWYGSAIHPLAIDGTDIYVQQHAALSPTKPRFTDVQAGHTFFKEIAWLDDRQITTGYQDGTFRPTDRITREAMAAFLYRNAGKPEFDYPDPGVHVPGEFRFIDIDEGDGFWRDIYWLASRNISRGWETPNGSEFRPKNQISREAMAAFLFRIAADPTYRPPTKANFSDVPTTHSFYREISWLEASGITTGYSDGTFRPRSGVSREATAAFLYRLNDR